MANIWRIAAQEPHPLQAPDPSHPESDRDRDHVCRGLHRVTGSFKNMMIGQITDSSIGICRSTARGISRPSTPFR
jgi:hypothetical protein